MLAVESLAAVYAGGSAGYQGTPAAFIMRVNFDSNAVKWRRFYQENGGTDLNVVTAMTLSPDGS